MVILMNMMMVVLTQAQGDVQQRQVGRQRQLQLRDGPAQQAAI